MNTSSIFTKAAAQQGERAADSIWDTSLMNYFDEVDSFEDFCKLLAKNIAKAHHGGTNLTDWKVYAKNKHVVHMVVAHYNSVVNQDGIPARWVMKFVAEGLARHLKNKPLWSTVSRGGRVVGSQHSSNTSMSDILATRATSHSLSVLRIGRYTHSLVLEVIGSAMC
ncbi:hypothetical protein ACTG15_12650 [Aeromonas sp. 164P]